MRNVRTIAHAFACVLIATLTVNAGPRPTPAPSPSPTPSIGDQLFAGGDFEGANIEYASAAASLPKDVDARMGLATVAVYHNDLDAATKDIADVIALEPLNVQAAQLKALIAKRRDDARTDTIAPYRSPVTIPFEVTDPLPLVHVSVNGRDGLFFIDTGVANLTLDPAFARDASVALTAAPAKVATSGARVLALQHGVAGTVRLGAVELRNVAVDGLPSRQLPYWGRQHADGVIGTRLLAHFLATIDYLHGGLILRPRTESANFERDAAAHGAYAVPMVLYDDHYLFARGHINNGAEGWFFVDTGLAGNGVLPSKAAIADSSIILNAQFAGEGIGLGGPMRTIPFVAGVVLGSRRVDGVPGIATPDGDSFGVFPFVTRGIISHSYFREIALTFDFTTMQLVMQP